MLTCYTLYVAQSERYHEFAAATDEDALEIAEDSREGRPAQLWCGKRLVARWQNVREWMLANAVDPGTDELIVDLQEADRSS